MASPRWGYEGRKRGAEFTAPRLFLTMSADTHVIAVIALIIGLGKMAGYASQKAGFPTAVGKIGLGLVIGPAMLGLVHLDANVRDLSELGVILLMFLAGLETDTETMRKVTIPALAVAVGGVVLPFAGGLGVGYAFHLGTAETLFLGAILTATSVSISAQTLRELGRLQSREGTTILAAAVIDDILGIVVLAFVFALSGGQDPLISIGKMVIFLPVAFVIGQKLLTPVARFALPQLPHEGQLAVLIAVALLYAWAAEALGGVAAVTGAYLAGLIVSQCNLTPRVSEGINWLAYSFFVPVFFVGIGLQADFTSIARTPLLLAALLFVAITGKVLGCYAGARAAGFSAGEGIRVGLGMMSRGEVALVVAAAGLQAGAVDDSLFSAAIAMALVTTVLTPICLKAAFARESGSSRREEQIEVAWADAV